MDSQSVPPDPQQPPRQPAAAPPPAHEPPAGGPHAQQPGGYPPPRTYQPYGQQPPQPQYQPQQPPPYPPYPQQPPYQQAPPHAQQPPYPQAPQPYPYQQQPPFWSPEQPPPWPGQPPPWAGTPYGPYGVPQVEPRTIAAPPGTPFHQLARNAKHTWWRPIVGTLFLVFLAFCVSAALMVVWAIAHTVITGDTPSLEGTEIFGNELEDLAFTLASLAVLTPPVLFAAWLVQRRPPWSVASVLNRLRWRWLLITCVPAIGYLLVSVGLSALADVLFPTTGTNPADEGSWVGFSAFLVPALLILLLVPFQAAAEEFAFRGWVIQAIGAYAPDGGRNGFTRLAARVLRTPWPALVVSSVLFVSLHGYTGWAMADIFLFAMVIGYLTVRTGGLEAAIALHTLNNLLAFLLPAATGTLDGWEEQGGAPWTVLAVDIPSLAFFAVAVLWLARRERIARLSG